MILAGRSMGCRVLAAGLRAVLRFIQTLAELPWPERAVTALSIFSLAGCNTGNTSIDRQLGRAAGHVFLLFWALSTSVLIIVLNVRLQSVYTEVLLPSAGSGASYASLGNASACQPAMALAGSGRPDVSGGPTAGLPRACAPKCFFQKINPPPPAAAGSSRRSFSLMPNYHHGFGFVFLSRFVLLR